MRLTRIEAHDFLGFHDLSLHDLSATLSVVVGPNGSGKSSLRRMLDLVTRAVRWSAESDRDAMDWLSVYTGAIRLGADEPRYSVRVGVELTEPDERELVVRWLRFAVMSTALRDHAHQVALDRVDAHLLERVDLEVAAPLFKGALTVLYEQAPYARFSVGYEFQFDSETYCLLFRGTQPPGVIHGALDSPCALPAGGSGPTKLLFADATTAADVTEETEPSFAFDRMLPAPGELALLSVTTNQAFQETKVSIQGTRALSLPSSGPSRSYSLDVVFAQLLDRVVVLADQRNSARHLYSGHELGTRSWNALRTEDLPLELTRLKLGDHHEQRQFQEIERRFHALTGVDFQIAMQQAPAPSSQETAADEPHFEIAVNIVDEHHAIPLELSGAGRWEALMLSAALTSDTGRVIVFDEPATSLHPSLQRTLLREIEARPAQSLLITHSPFLVPSGSSEDLQRVIRVDRIGDRTTVHRLTTPAGSATPSADAAAAKLHQLIAGSSDVRGLLFARAVILLEGESDLGALEHWLADSSTADPVPHELNLVLSAVGGDSRFGSFTSYLDAFGIPWVIICDGPALSPSYDHSLCQQIMRAGQSVHPPDLEDFAAWRANWTKYGVYTLADDFEDEIENLLERIDPDTWKAAKAEFPRSKVRAARAFAEQTPPPERVHQIYRQAIDFLGLSPG